MAKVRWREIAEALRADIESGNFKVGAVMPTEEQLASQWMVSRMTVHRAMQELQRQGLVTRRQGSGTVVTAPQARIAGPVALLFPNWLNLLEIELLRGISAALGEGQQIFFCDTSGQAETEARYLQRMSKQAAGIICVPTCAPQNTPLLQGIVASGFPLVCVDRVPPGVTADAVVTANYEASATALRMVTARGHRRLAHFTHDILEVSSVRERLEAFLDVAHEVGQEEPERWVRRFPRDVADFDSLTELVQEALAALLQAAQPPTAVFCMNDWLLPSLLEACARLEVRVPEALEIVSFNDAPLLLPVMKARIYQIAQKPHLIGQLAAERLAARLRGDTTGPEIIRVPAEVLPPSLYAPAASLTG